MVEEIDDVQNEAGKVVKADRGNPDRSVEASGPGDVGSADNINDEAAGRNEESDSEIDLAGNEDNDDDMYDVSRTGSGAHLIDEDKKDAMVENKQIQRIR